MLRTAIADEPLGVFVDLDPVDEVAGSGRGDPPGSPARPDDRLVGGSLRRDADQHRLPESAGAGG